MPGRSHDHLIQEPRIPRGVRRPVVGAVPAPREAPEPAQRDGDARVEQVRHEEPRPLTGA